MTDNEIMESASEASYAVTVSESVSPSQRTGTPLTPREIEIVQLLAEAKSNKQIAAELGISVRTVEMHRRHVMQKLRVRSLVEIVFYAMDHCIVPRR